MWVHTIITQGTPVTTGLDDPAGVVEVLLFQDNGVRKVELSADGGLVNVYETKVSYN